VRIHVLKSRPENIEAVKDGRPFDVRKNDRPFGVGDWLHLREYMKLPAGKYGDLHVFAPICAMQYLPTAPYIVDDMIAAVDQGVVTPDPKDDENVSDVVIEALGHYVILGLDLRVMQFVRSEEGARVISKRIETGEMRWAR
jgi:hypothetical protein